MSNRQQRRQQNRRALQKRAATSTGVPVPGSGRSASSRGWLWPVTAGLVVVILAVAGIGFAAAHQSASSHTPTVATQTAAPSVDGIQCGAMESLAYHIHQYLELYDHGKRVQVPSEIGIPGGEPYSTCFYWIHVHASTPDIIHVESPIHKTFTLGNFFDVWKATRNDAVPSGDAYVRKLQSAAASGQVTAYLNGKKWTGNYRSIPLKEHETITVEIGKPLVKPVLNTNWNGL